MEALLVVLLLLITVVLCNEEGICQNLHDKFYCEHGCCGDYRKERCCSVAGTIVGIVIGVALFIGIIASLIYCYIKKRGRPGSIFPFGGRSNEPGGQGRANARPQGHLTVLQTTHCYNAGRGRRGFNSSVANHPGLLPYNDVVKPPLPPAYEPALPPPPPYSAISGQTVHGINSVDSYNQAYTTPPVS